MYLRAEIASGTQGGPKGWMSDPPTRRIRAGHGAWTSAWAVLCALPLMGAAPAPDRLDDARWCRLCHPAERFGPPAWAQTAHAAQTRRDCHAGYHFDPHRPVTLSPGVEAGLAPGDAAALRRQTARDTCVECHQDALPEGVVHGEGAPTCDDCHGDPHRIRARAGRPVVEARVAMNARCSACHAHGVLEAYDHSVHGRKLALGSSRAPACHDCHGAHALVALTEDGAARCAPCHAQATAEFVLTADHRPYTRESRPVSYFTLKFFAWLTFLAITALALHVLLDAQSALRRALRPPPRDGT